MGTFVCLCGTECEFDCIAEQNAPHFRHFVTQISACVAVFYYVKSYTNLSLMMNEQKIALQNFQMNSHPDVVKVHIPRSKVI